MSPKEKAEQLVAKFDGVGLQMRNEAIACALIAVDECLGAVESDWGFMQKRIEFWHEVKTEIENL
jgi:hypothetical protein